VLACGVAVRACTVSFKGVSGVRHSIDVEADSLYEAAIKAVARFREDPWMEQVAPATVLDVEIREPATKHSVSLHQLETWLASTSKAPQIASKKVRLKMLLMRG
jgi:hypothetical protein